MQLFCILPPNLTYLIFLIIFLKLKIHQLSQLAAINKLIVQEAESFWIAHQFRE